MLKSFLSKAGHFVWHAVEMCFVMCAGMMVLGLVYGKLMGSIGYASPRLQLPELTALVLAFNMTLPMAAWMRIRGMEWRPIIEMSAAMFIEAVILIGLAWLGVVQRSDLSTLVHNWMVPAMIIPMLLRLDVYTGHHGGHKAACH